MNNDNCQAVAIYAFVSWGSYAIYAQVCQIKADTDPTLPHSFQQLCFPFIILGVVCTPEQRRYTNVYEKYKASIKKSGGGEGGEGIAMQFINSSSLKYLNHLNVTLKTEGV